MTQRQSILKHMHQHPGLCDGCLAQRLGIKPPQSVNRICRHEAAVSRGQVTCPACAQPKIRNFLKNSPSPSFSKPQKLKKSISRNQNLKTQLNDALVSIFRLQERDYYGELTFAQLLILKQALARIHDTVTLKLTFQLVHWIAERFRLTEEKKAALREQVDSQSANASGFDLSWNDPKVIAEVKGCIPMNGGNVFGAAQWKGLTNDLRQMLGLPALGKTKEQLSLRSKVFREGNVDAIKFLALYDCPEVRTAASKWRASMYETAWFKELNPPIQLLEAPETGIPCVPPNVYLVYLKPDPS